MRLTAIPFLSLLCLPALAPCLPAQQFLFERFSAQPGKYHRPNLTWGDIDGDGDIDVITPNDYAGNNILINDGHGRFTDEMAQRITYTTSQATYRAELYDYDGDGDLDLFNTNDHVCRESLFLNNGKGVFTDVTTTHLPQRNWWTVYHVTADFDGDGDPDVVVLAADPGGTELWLNNGAGVFTVATWSQFLNLSIGYTDWAEAHDIDCDGDMDLVFRRSSGQISEIRLNDGSGRFSQASYPALTSGLTDPEFADFNGDGRIDVLDGSTRKLFLNQPGTGFVDMGATHLPPGTRTYMGPMDVDNDGDLDLVNGPIAINDGTGRFQDVSSTRGTLTLGQPFFAADLDGDQDQDIFGVFWYSLNVAKNTWRHINAPAAPKVGQSYLLDLYHQPSYGTTTVDMYPIFTTRFATTPLPGLGLFHLDPTLLLVLPKVTLPVAGTGQVSLNIPNLPGLVGMDLGFQCLTVTPGGVPGLTNCMVDTIQ